MGMAQNAAMKIFPYSGAKMTELQGASNRTCVVLKSAMADNQKIVALHHSQEVIPKWVTLRLYSI
jgi:hypothetical protein